MNKVLNYRRFIINMIGILPLILSLGTSKVAFAATLTATSDLSLTLVADQSKVKMGQTVTYTATMTNLGPDDAIDVAVAIFLPDQLNIVSLTCDRVSNDGTFCEYSTLAAGETVVETLVATPTPGSLTKPRKLTVTANVFLLTDCNFDPHCTFDPDLSNNSASVTTKLIGKLAHP
ncbi:MAG TPA: DUF11 domain-containing protein [Anaerolineales bacterium]|nr:DUF11 domain-containing protein [Anaerolineales bacterium]